MRWAVAFHPDQIKTLPNGWKCLMVPPMQIAEHCIPAAVGQGWIVIGTDTEILEQPLVDAPAQSNPHRVKHGYGYSEGDNV